MFIVSRLLMQGFAVCSIAWLLGCAQTAKVDLLSEDMPDRILEFAQLRPEVDIEKLRKVDAFVECMKPQDQIIKPSVKKVFSRLRERFRELRSDGLSDLPFFSGDIKGWAKERLGGFDATMLWQRGALRELLGDLDPHNPNRRTRLIETYLKAYFGAGENRFVALDAKDRKKWQANIASALKLPLDAPMVRQLRDDYILQFSDVTLPQELKQIHVPLPKAAPGFISRDGTRYQFPGLTIKGASASIDHSQIGADLIRIAMEAFRDTYAPLPAVAYATAVKSKGATEQTIELFALGSAWNGDENRFANHAEAIVAGAVGKAIRGGAWGSLNNEALARVIETAAGVLARHSAERIGWCSSKAKQPAPAETSL
jgi:hypothetical protein